MVPAEESASDLQRSRTKSEPGKSLDEIDQIDHLGQLLDDDDDDDESIPELVDAAEIARKVPVTIITGNFFNVLIYKKYINI